MRFLKPKRLYYDPYGNQDEFRAGWFEVYMAKEGYEDMVEKSIVSRRMAHEALWEKKSTLFRFYVGKVGVVIAFWDYKRPTRFQRIKGVASFSIGKMVMNVFDARPSKERK